jgi:two-component system, NarL family, sensor histidine kinase DesK
VTDWWATILSILVFLPLYFRFYWAKGPERVLCLLLIAGIGALLLPRNPMAHTYFMYACILSAFLPWRDMLLTIVPAFGTMVLGLTQLQINWQSMAFIFGLTALIATLGSRVWINYARKNSALRASQEELQHLAQMAERERIGRDLHDLLGHTLSLVAIKAELAHRLIERDPQQARTEIGEVMQVAREALSEVRSAVTGMRAHGFLAECAKARVAVQSAQIRFRYENAPVLLDDLVESTLSWVLREAVTNILRHARAANVLARWEQDAGHISLVIEDDGKGGVKRHGNGLIGMQERLAAVHASLEIESPPGKGTRLRIRLPWPRPGSDAMAMPNTPHAESPQAPMMLEHT